MKANNDVTEALQRTIGLMQGELERSVLSTQLLGVCKLDADTARPCFSHQSTESSTAALKSTSSTHDVLDSLMTTSKHLITALEKSDWMDRMLIFAGLIFFVLVVLFILKQRLVDRSLRIALWWTRFIPDFSGDEALLAMEKGEVSLTASSVVATASAVVTTVATVAASLASSVAYVESTDLLASSMEASTAVSDIPSTVASEPSASPDPDATTASSVPLDTTSGSHDEL